MIVGSKANHNSYSKATFHMTPGVEGFLETNVKLTASELTHALEAWNVGGGAAGKSRPLSPRRLHTADVLLFKPGVASRFGRTHNTRKAEVSTRLNLLLRKLGLSYW